MQQPCQRCGYVSDRPTRFCRQCGAQLFVENEATSAPTRQQPPQQSANPYDAPYQSQLAQSQVAPDSRFDGQTPDTSRLYHAPMGQNYPSYPPNYQPAEPKKSGALKWVLITLLCVVMVSCGVGAMVLSAIRAKQAAADHAIDAILKEAERVKQEMERAEKEAPPAPPPAPPPPPSSNVEGLDRYKYPNATVKNSVSVMGNEVVEMSTTDSIDKVREHYKNQLGESTLEHENDAAVIFRTSGSPMIVVTISKDKQYSDKTEVVLVRTNFRFPK